MSELKEIGCAIALVAAGVIAWVAIVVVQVLAAVALVAGIVGGSAWVIIKIFQLTGVL